MLTLMHVCPQAATDGSLGVLVDKVRSQPQVFRAYSKTAAIRDRNFTAEFQAIVLPLKVGKIWPQSVMRSSRVD